MIRSRTDKTTAGSQRLEVACGVRTRCVQMLDDFRADHQVKRLASEIRENEFVGRQHFEASVRIGLARERYAAFAQIDADHIAASLQKLSGGETVAAADVEHARAGCQTTAECQDSRHEPAVHVPW